MFQIDPVGSFDAKGFGDIAFGGLGRVGGDPIEDLGLAGNGAHISRLSRPDDEVMSKKATSAFQAMQIRKRIHVCQCIRQRNTVIGQGLHSVCQGMFARPTRVLKYALW